jgi:hypothetical protein
MLRDSTAALSEAVKCRQWQSEPTVRLQEETVIPPPFPSERSGIFGLTRLQSAFPDRQAHAPRKQSTAEEDASAKRLNAILTELSELTEGARAEGRASPNDSAIAGTRALAKLCVSFRLPEPTIDLNDDGSVEFFIRTRSRGILFILRQDDLLQVFGDFESEPWRARYQISGKTWKLHLPTYLASLESESSPPPT